MASKPVYVVVPPGALRDACLSSLSGRAEAVEPPLRPEALAGRPPGVVLADVAGVTADELLGAADALRGPEWVLAVVDRGNPPSIRTVSSGLPCDLDGVALHADGAAEGSEALLELHGVLEEISRARHDINNPLTSALAETQILLLDAPEGELRDGLDTIQTQLRRIRDLVAATRHLRPQR
jgi:signal transduction histidine kinase